MVVILPVVCTKIRQLFGKSETQDLSSLPFFPTNILRFFRQHANSLINHQLCRWLHFDQYWMRAGMKRVGKGEVPPLSTVG